MRHRFVMSTKQIQSYIVDRNTPLPILTVLRMRLIACDIFYCIIKFDKCTINKCDTNHI